jgi:hypothetical protein
MIAPGRTGDEIEAFVIAAKIRPYQWVTPAKKPRQRA